jgi:hypothetical protein
MRPRDWFSVGIRLLGAWVFYNGFVDLIYVGALLLGVAPHYIVDKDYGSLEKASIGYLWYAAGRFALAIYFVFFTEHLARWVFDTPNPDAPDDSDYVQMIDRTQ